MRPKRKRFHCLLIIITLSACISNVWAQDLHTNDGLSFTHGSSTSGQPLADAKGVATDTWVPLQAREPVIMNFDNLPGSQWESWDCGDGVGKSTVQNGILKINSASCYEFLLNHPKDTWHKYVSNARGWVIETSMRVDPSTQPDCTDGALMIWANDHTNLLIVGFSTNAVCLTYPDQVRSYMNTTDAFHIYRIESKGREVKIYVDGKLKINHALSWSGGGSDVLAFGDGNGAKRSLSYWDYFSYDIFP
jgi:hypothetical protein